MLHVGTPMRLAIRNPKAVLFGRTVIPEWDPACMTATAVIPLHRTVQSMGGVVLTHHSVQHSTVNFVI